MIADVLVARGIPVRHIMSPMQARPHELTDFAVVRRSQHKALVTYPAPG